MNAGDRPGVGDAHVRAARLAGLHLRGGTSGDLAGAVGHLLAVQAQEFQPALWGLSRRMAPAAHPTAASLNAAFDAGAIVRTHVLRPTWHVLRPDDARWLLALTAPRVHQVNNYPYRAFGVDDRFTGSTDVLADAVADGPRTRAELVAVLDEHGMPAEKLLLGYLLMRAELDQVLISGPMVGKQQTYAAFDARVPAGYGPLGATFDRDGALVELVRRYLRGRRYATVKDMATWSGLTMKDIRRGLDLLGAEARAVSGRGRLEGLTLWCLDDQDPGEPSGAGDAAVPVQGDPVQGTTVDLLQAYDELFVSFRESRHVVFEPGVDLGTQREAAIHSVAIGGKVVGRRKWPAKADGEVATTWLRGISLFELAAYAEQVEALAAYRNPGG